MGIGTREALQSGDLDAAQVAIDQVDEVLNPELWAEILMAVPFVNIVTTLQNDFYPAAATTNQIYQRIVNDQRQKAANGESDAEMYARIEKERTSRRDAEKKSDAEYYSNIAKLRSEAKAAERLADETYFSNLSSKQQAEERQRRIESERYWAGILKDREEYEANKRRLDLAYWDQYFREMQRYRDNTSGSNLKFGLL